jgi:hypothetical protein
VDQARVDELRRWARELLESPREETRAAGKAILMLTDEIESLTVALEAAREAPETAPPSTAEGDEDFDEGESLETEDRGLVGRLRRRLGSNTH